MLFGFLIFVQVVVALLMVFLVLLQGGRGAELGAAFGGMGQSQSNRGPMTGIAKVTSITAAIFMVTSLSLAYLSTEQATDSVVSGIKAPVDPGPKTSEAEKSQTSDNPASNQENPSESVEQSDAPKMEQTDAPPPAEPKPSN
ncbi:MAG: preprotein translocase subunit SecG [SAR324 cluster bacterium]|nr:preprotein translocase subunit SecG [SAR324 cluster bacterium]